MIPNINMHEQFAHKHRQVLLREAELKRKLAEAQPAPPLHWLHRFATRLGGFFLAFGTRLQRAPALE
jgi:hypothetical protein